jgi:pyridoxal phosphate enzyme (YggS family)
MPESMISYEEFDSRVRSIEERIADSCRSCGREASSVRLMAVTKTHGPWSVEYAETFGLRCVGENRVQEAEGKRAGLKGMGQGGIAWELIGSLQSNKAKLAASLFERVQSVDRLKLANELEKHCAALGRKLPVLLEINAGRDPAKHGAEIEDAPALLEGALNCAHLEVQGLMTIAPLSEDRAVAQRTFATLRELRDRLSVDFGVPLAELSMGMSGDMEEAVREGSTLVRIGTALFGARVYPA